MTTAQDKLAQAFSTLLGNAKLTEHLGKYRIGVVSSASTDTISGRLLAEALGEALGRLWPCLHAKGPLTQIVLASAAKAAASADLSLTTSDGWSPPYDAIIVMGQEEISNAGPITKIGANGWEVSSGSFAHTGDSPNPVGPAAAAALAAADVFKQVFGNALSDHCPSYLDDLTWNVWTQGRDIASPSSPPGIALPRTHMFGTGAVTHGLCWVFERWPGEVTGELLLIDHDRYDCSNGQRYVGMRHSDIGFKKVNSIAERLSRAHPNLRVSPFDTDMNGYFDDAEPEPDVRLALVGLDSAESRRHAALKLPRRTVNMWTDRHHLGSSRFGHKDGWPCLFCSYQELLTGEKDEVAIITEQTGLLPHRVRHLLDTGMGLALEDAVIVANRIQKAAESLVDQPIRTVLHQLCATGSVSLPGAEIVDVPFVFSSFLAGVVGFSNMLGELWTPNDSPFRWGYNVMKRPLPALAAAVHPRADCFLCS